MANIQSSLIDVIGRTPLVALSRLEAALGLQARLLAKVESFNPGGSVKDRPALAMIEAAERSGALAPGGVIVEPTSGNTGVALAWIGAIKGYRVVLTMPETMSIERRSLLAAYGAQLVLTPGAEGMRGAIARAEAIAAATPGAFIPGQFDNPANPAAHESGTAEEIWHDTDGRIDAFVAGVGTGGTLSGTSRALKRRNPAVVTVGVEPADSPVLSGGQPGKHALQGIGAGFVPRNFDAAAVDRLATVTQADAFAAARRLARTEGLLAGISSGAALHAACALAAEAGMKGKNIVVLLPDTGERYLSTELF